MTDMKFYMNYVYIFWSQFNCSISMYIKKCTLYDNYRLSEVYKLETDHISLRHPSRVNAQNSNSASTGFKKESDCM